MFACLHGTGNLAALALEFSPVVEQTGPQTVTLDASGLDRLFGLPHDVAAAIARRAGETGARVRIALASNPDAAICAARGFAGINIVPHGDEAKFLGELPLEQLDPSSALLETLERWGIRRFRELAALPPLGIAERLGPEGLRLRELARGEAERKLRPIEEPARYEDEIELEYPVDLLEHADCDRLILRIPPAENVVPLFFRCPSRSCHISPFVGGLRAASRHEGYLARTERRRRQLRRAFAAVRRN